MRPISLSIEGIKSFDKVQKVNFDFDGLFCISGNTGSGKTTILDCIIVALYGAKKGEGAGLINLKRSTAEITFEFETDTEEGRQRFEVVRSLTRKSNGKAKLTNLTTGAVIAEQIENVNAAIEQLTMLKRDEFTQVVILEQGKFSRFLSATKKERNETVANLFRLNKYKGLGPKFGRRKELAQQAYNFVSDRIAELSGVTQAVIKDKEKELKASEERLTSLEKEIERLDGEVRAFLAVKSVYEKCLEAEKNLSSEVAKKAELSDRLAKAQEEFASVSERFDKLTKEVSECQKVEASGNALRGLLAEKDSREKSLSLRREEYVRAAEESKSIKVEYDEAVEKARKYRSMLDSCIGDIFLIANFGEKSGYYDVIDIRAKAEKSVAAYSSAKSKYDEAVKAQAEAEKRVSTDSDKLLKFIGAEKLISENYESIKAEVDELNKKRELERRNEAASYIRSTLKKGDVCPVCGGVIGELCLTEIGDSVDTLLKSKEGELKQADERLKDIRTNHAIAATNYDASQKQLSEANDRVKSSELELQKATEPFKQPSKIGELIAFTQKACEITTALNAASSSVELLNQRLIASQNRAEEIKKLGEKERDDLGRLKERLSGEFEVTEKLLKENADRFNLLTKLLAEAKENKEKSQAMLSEITSALNVCQTKIELFGEQAAQKPNFNEGELKLKQDELLKLGNEKTSLIATNAKGNSEIEQMKKSYEQKLEFEKQRAECKKELDIYSELSKLFVGDKFVDFIAEDYVLQFTRAASDVLNRITNGKYTLEYVDGQFSVVDFLSGGKSRSADTLSGGEIFLASLSLAIAISREIARFKSYEFFFLDEGFGTLDAAFIQSVLDALNSLSTDTLVGLVTHRTELTERIYDKLTVIPASGDQGSVIVRS